MKFPTVLILALLIVVVIVAGYFLIKSRIDNVAILRPQVSEKEQLVLSKEKELKDLAEIETLYNQAKRRIEDIPHILPKGDQIPELLIQLDALAKESGLGMTSISITPGAEEEGALYKTLNISVAVTGSYDNLKKYLDKVEKNMRIMDVTSIDFSATPVVPEGPVDVFSYTINIKTYYIE